MQEFKKGQYSGTITGAGGRQGVLCSTTVYDSHSFNGALHYHENIHISLVLGGGCLEKKKDSYERVPGKLTYYHAGEPHQVLRVPAASKHFNLEIEQEFLSRYDIDEGKLGQAFTENPDGRFLMLKICKELAMPGLSAESAIEMLLLDFYMGDKMVHDIAPPIWINLIRDALQDRWDENPTLEELSRLAGVHPVTVSKNFHKYFGCTLSGYLRKIKIGRALALMAGSEITLTETAFRCGFADQSHFIRTFKCLTGFRPKKYLDAAATG